MLVFLSSCGTQRKARKARKNVQIPTVAPAAPGAPLTRDQYIAQYQDIALKEMKRTGIPASIIMAQAILESGNGNSRLAREANNHFGIKCHNGWTGPTMHQKDDGPNDCFRVYKHVEESFKDHGDFLTRNIRYAFLFDLKPTDYEGWAKGLKKAGYATNPQYPELLIGLIERHQLHVLDAGNKAVRPPSDPVVPPGREVEKNGAKESVTKSSAQEKTEAGYSSKEPKYKPPQENSGKVGPGKGDSTTVKKDSVGRAKPGVQRTYTVQPGETLYSISRQLGVDMSIIKELNKLEGEALTPGQVLRLP